MSGYKTENRENAWNREVAKKPGKDHEEAMQTIFLSNELEEELEEVFLLNIECNDKVSSNISKILPLNSGQNVFYCIR